MPTQDTASVLQVRRLLIGASISIHADRLSVVDAIDHSARVGEFSPCDRAWARASAYRALAKICPAQSTLFSLDTEKACTIIRAALSQPWAPS